MVEERKIYGEEFKRHAVEMVRCSDKSAAQVARELGIKKKTMSNWICKSRISDEGTVITDSDITKLKKELANVKEERDILKKAIAIFSKQPNRNSDLS